MDTFSILFVCTGNICRSPLAELALRHNLRAKSENITVSSVGTHALVGRGMEEPNIRIAQRWGIPDASVHAARQLDSNAVTGADLILALAREHRRRVVELVPSATRRTFTLREFARLAPYASCAEIEANVTEDSVFGNTDFSFIDTVNAARSLAPRLEDPADDDIVDPYKLGFEIFELQAKQMLPSIQETANVLSRNID